MSWSARYEITDANYVSNLTKSNVDEVPEHRKQYLAAKYAIEDIIGGGSLGTGEFFVQLSGHGNPDNKPRDGWANDCVTISITQKGAP